ncbi:hypothetical protein GCG54_00010298 [Colletotrichum gloeosporioides]|uniref:Uncharacterized protein n=1 Tax=Colletotrichum gloeosporioides TaxID=474922 RepID=A0A8H4FGC4_COLGL|nr:uncharacterized protein GCG54_00010298 [Colletotrichum gloeosporioides]KAF3801020.1 hypothetical protein GCG54_00010298 [Colletotrichum gloeosporioides]
MRFAQIFMLAATMSGAFAGKNCKCQDPSGKGPQWNGLTKQCCNGDVNAGCFFAPNFPGPNNQVHYFGSLENSHCTGVGNCLNSGAFNDCCKSKGAPGAYCW